MKICSKCKINKEYTDFGKCNQVKDGYKSQCKSCRTIVGKKYYDNNIEKIKFYLEENSELIKEKKKYIKILVKYWKLI